MTSGGRKLLDSDSTRSAFVFFPNLKQKKPCVFEDTRGSGQEYQVTR